MKRIFIFYILTVLIMTFVLTRPKGKTDNPVVSKEEIENYRQSLAKYGESEETVNKAVEMYVDVQTKVKEADREGMPFKKALKASLISVAILLGGMWITFQLQSSYYNELYGTHMGSNDRIAPRGLIMRFFFGDWK